MSTRPKLDVSGLPTVVFGSRTQMWWATMGIVAIEGTLFLLLVMAYLFLRTRAVDWPAGVLPPFPLWGTINVALVLVSILPNHWLKKRAKAGDLRGVRIGLIVISLMGLVALVFRALEFPALGVRWDANAYASIAWVLLGFHTVHLLTDWVDTVVLLVLFFTDRIEGKRYQDAYENCDYWYFVVWTWIAIYVVLYWVPRWI